MRSSSLRTLRLPSCRSNILFRNQSSAAADHGGDSNKSFQWGRGDLRCWQIHSYSGIQDLQFSSVRVPPLRIPTDVMVEVHAASVNPIDVAMSKGYGAGTINLMRRLCASSNSPLDLLKIGGPQIEFPITLGRDFAGRIVQMGPAAKGKGLNVGDEVYGVVGVQRQGSHANLVVASVDTIRQKPANLSFVEAASIPYVALTTLAALRTTGGYHSLQGKKFLVLGGSGGVGTFAVQYLKAKGAFVVTTCSADAVELLSSLKSDFVIDYKMTEFIDMVKLHAPYDCILDLSGPANATKALEVTPYLKQTFGQYITLSPPFLSNMDNYGLLGGALQNLRDLASTNLQTMQKGSVISKWAFFIPDGSALEELTPLLESQRILPVIQSTYKFQETPAAYEALNKGHARGKIVLDINS